MVVGRMLGRVGSGHGGALGCAVGGGRSAMPLGRCSANRAAHVIVVVLGVCAAVLGPFVMAVPAAWRHFRVGSAGSSVLARSF
jgi:hypothetical protein